MTPGVDAQNCEVRQIVGDRPIRIVNELTLVLHFSYVETALSAGRTVQLLLVLRRGGGTPAKFFRRAHRLERARHHLGSANATAVVGGFRLEQLGVREDDAQLIVQPVKEETQVYRFPHDALVLTFPDLATAVQACLRSSCGGHGVVSSTRSFLLGSRQRASTKIRTDPPAVRTYSIFPAESQL